MSSQTGSEEILLVDYRPDYKEGILQLMSSVPYKGAIWEWQFEDNPFGLAFEPIVVTDGNSVIGFNGAMQVEVIYNGEYIEAMWSCDFYVHKDYRGKGLGKIIKNKQFDSRNLIMALGLSDIATYVWRKKKCEPNTDLKILRKYTKANTRRKKLLRLIQATEYIKGTPLRLHKESHAIQVTDKLEDASLVNSLWDKVSASYRKSIVRNYPYLHWRYEKHPLAKYRFIHIKDNNNLVAIGVFRKYKNQAKFVDLLAHANDIDARLSLVKGWLKLYDSAEMYSCTTTDRLLIKCLKAWGFYQTRDNAWFFAHSNFADDASPQQDWFIMPGDSDGEFLEAAENGFEQAANKSDIRVERLKDSKAFDNLRTEWEQVLGESKANRLFLSWQWQYTWWETWAKSLDLELLLLTAYQGNKLVGIAPLYIDNIQLRTGFHLRRIQFIGNAWNRMGTVRTEYLEFITSEHCATEVCKAFTDYIDGIKCWDEFIICDLKRTSETYRQIIQYKKKHGWFIDVADTDKGMRIATNGTFSAYVKNLGRNTRLKLFNRRKYLNTLGEVSNVEASENKRNEYFKILNDFHVKRWGKACFSGPSLEFHKRLLDRFGNDQHYSLSCLYLNNQAVSLLYNITAGNTVYNIQSGFNQTFDSKLSLGTLHMGYAIEEAFYDPAVSSFDLLAGEGKTEFYKKKYRGETVEFTTLRITRSRFLFLIHAIYKCIPEKIKCLASKLLGYVRQCR